MSSWASRRKLLYGSGGILFVVIPICLLIFFYLYKPPTCSDGKRNGDEFGVDCGGSCVRLCQSSFLPLKVKWGGAKFEKLTNGLYNAAAYVVNDNTDGAAKNVPYAISLFDNRGVLIVERKGKLTIPPHRNALAFEPAIEVGERIPAKATFELLEPPLWFKSEDTLGGISVIDQKYEEDETSSFLEVTLENKTLNVYKDIIVSVVLYDSDGNVQGFSKTKIDKINAKGGREIAPFTWSKSRGGVVSSIEVILLDE
jgi:hypothetical protein